MDVADYEVYVSYQHNPDSKDAAWESADRLDVPGTREWVWPLTDWWPADYARLRQTPASGYVWWR